MNRTEKAEKIFQQACNEAIERRHELLCPEHLLLAFAKTEEGEKIFESYNTEIKDVFSSLQSFFSQHYDINLENFELMFSYQMQQVVDQSEYSATCAGKDEVDVPQMLQAFFDLEDSFASYLLAKYTTTDQAEFLSVAIAAYRGEELPKHFPESGPDKEDDEYYDLDDFYAQQDEKSEPWRSLVTLINYQVAEHNPLIGREAELERTIQVLCRKEKNNPLHVGEPGVGKTALIYGLVERILLNDVPARLQGANIYQMDMAAMVAGTSYRGEFEKRIKMVLDGASKEKNAIIYIDEIHNIIGAGATGEGSLDGSNILKPYLESGNLRFIGSTTYQEYNRHLRQSKGFIRRFQQIDIPEPSVEETVGILEGLKEIYEKHHGVTYGEGVLQYVVKAAVKYINDRFLPDKAIDLLDEAGAYRQIHPLMRKYRGLERLAKKQTVDESLINQVISRMCKVDISTVDTHDNQHLEKLSARISSEIYGQDEAVRQVVEAVQMGKAGLLDEGKPIASMLFVGPTGVGKTEVCKVLARELGIALVRFDMSEYTEKHAVAKLIGTPAGYVGYDDGGLLTDAIRKTPNCVLLLDEIEKAHSDIYNILLQVMDYARLTDNKGNQADFRNVILVMTSNAGAQHAHLASIGFGNVVSAGSAMLAEVKKLFKPEFIARLSATVVFNDMDQTMAGLILDKKLRQLSQRLAARHVAMTLSTPAHQFLLERAFATRNGAREMDRLINQLVSPLLMREMLFGRLKNGGVAALDREGDKLIIKDISNP